MLIETDVTSRFRELNLLNFQQGDSTISFGPDCQVAHTPIGGSQHGNYKSMYDVPTKNFKKLSSQGAIINSPMQRFTADFTVTDGPWQVSNHAFNCTTGSGHWKYWHKSVIHSIAGGLSANPVWTLPVDDLTARASTAALADVNAPDVLGSANIKEIGQTYASIRHPLKALRGILAKHKKLVKDLNRIDYLRRKSLRGPLTSSERDLLMNSEHSKYVLSVGQVRDASSQYLELVFGILPTMRDIAGAVESVCKPRVLRATARGNYSLKTSSSIETQYYTSSALNLWLVTDTTETVDVRVGILYDASLRTQSDRLGVSPKDAVAFAWEVLPWSFVVDWFSNTGDYLSALSNELTQSHLSQWITTRRTLSIARKDSRYVYTGPWSTDIVPSGGDSVKFELYQRSPFPTIGDHVKIRLDLDLDRANIGAAFALTMQQLTRR